MWCRYLLLSIIGLATIFAQINAESNSDVDSDKRKFRYHVAILDIQEANPKLVCGGAIIHRRFVLTSAYCVNQYRSRNLIVRSGAVKGADPATPYKVPQSFHEVGKIYIPKSYSALPCRRHQHDIAILKVKQGFDLSYDERYKKSVLPEIDNDYEDAEAEISGYGSNYVNKSSAEKPKDSENKSLQYASKLRSLPVSVLSNEECQRRSDIIITEGSLCVETVQDASHTCFEDVGSPLVHDGVIIGVSNYRNCEAKTPETFTRVTSYLPFITKVLRHQYSPDVLIR